MPSIALSMVSLAWLALALVHTPPALATVSARLRRRMYGVESSGPLDLILVHRGVLFLGVASVCVFAAFSVEARPAAVLIVAISLLGFLIAYALTGAPQRLRTIALVDAAALVPFGLVALDILPWLSHL